MASPYGARRRAPERDDAELGALVGDRDLRAQLVEAEAPGEIGRLRGGAVDEEGRARFAWDAHDDHVEQDLALRRKQAGVTRLATVQRLDVVGEKPLQEGRGVLAAHAEDPAVVEKRGLVVMRCDSDPACIAGPC